MHGCMLDNACLLHSLFHTILDRLLADMKDQNIKKTAVVRIVIESMSGKENALSPAHTVINNPSPEMR